MQANRDARLAQSQRVTAPEEKVEALDLTQLKIQLEMIPDLRMDDQFVGQNE